MKFSPLTKYGLRRNLCLKTAQRDTFRIQRFKNDPEGFPSYYKAVVNQDGADDALGDNQ